jgi:hypothetical protein
MILVFDLGDPLLAYSLLRSAGMSAVAALVLSGVLPALGIVAIVITASTGVALVCSKLIPYVFAVALSAWTLVYGEHEKKKAERLASSVGAGT